MVSMGYEINWSAAEHDAILSTEQYIKYSQKSFNDLNPLQLAIKADIGSAIASNESAEVINYLCWLIRVVNLIA